MLRLAIALALTVTACTVASVTSDASPAAAASLAPSGKWRAAINFGNPILATRDAATGEARGVSVDLARYLAEFVEEMKASGFVASAEATRDRRRGARATGNTSVRMTRG